MFIFFVVSLFLVQAPAPSPAPSPAPGPIIVQTVRQPPITREITMGDVVLGAVGFVGVVMIAAAVAGLLIGIVVVMVKRSRDRAAGPPIQVTRSSEASASLLPRRTPPSRRDACCRARFRRSSSTWILAARTESGLSSLS